MRQRLADQWPFLVTSVGVVLMGLFLLTTEEPLAGWVFVGFVAVCVAGIVARAAWDAVRAARE